MRPEYADVRTHDNLASGIFELLAQWAVDKAID
jgi:hypothetical protein